MKAFLRYSILLLALTQCDKGHDAAHSADNGNQPSSAIIYSPNGEPLNGGPLGRISCERAMDGWFDRLSVESGHISLLAFINDAQTQFHRMDIDGNGYIVSEEIDRYREPYRQELVKQTEGKAKHNKGEENRSDPSLSQSDPVMSADVNLDFKVTLDEFMKQAQDNFNKLSSNGNSLERVAILRSCGQAKP